MGYPSLGLYSVYACHFGIGSGYASKEEHDGIEKNPEIVETAARAEDILVVKALTLMRIPHLKDLHFAFRPSSASFAISWHCVLAIPTIQHA